MVRSSKGAPAVGMLHDGLQQGLAGERDARGSIREGLHDPLRPEPSPLLVQGVAQPVAVQHDHFAGLEVDRGGRVGRVGEDAERQAGTGQLQPLDRTVRPADERTLVAGVGEREPMRRGSSSARIIVTKRLSKAPSKTC